MKVEMKPLSSAEAIEIVGDLKDEGNKEIQSFVKKFSKINLKKAKELRTELESLGLIKLNKEHISKIIDLLPEEASDINKIFTDVSLDEDETNKLLEIVKKYR